MDSPAELRKIEKEIIEARALIIKSNNLANSLSAEVRTVARRQADYERGAFWNSFVAYLLFAVLVFIGAQVAFNARQASLQDDLNRAEEAAAEAKKELQELRKETGGGARVEEKDLVELYQLITEGRRQEAVTAYEALNPASFSYLEKKLLDDTINRFRDDLSMSQYIRAMELLAARKFPEAIEAFNESLRLKDNAGHAKAARIYMAEALRLQGKPREAIAILQKVSEEYLSREMADDALWYLAMSHQGAYQKDEALSVLKTLMRRHPDSQFYKDARIRAAELKLHMWRDDKDN